VGAGEGQARPPAPSGLPVFGNLEERFLPPAEHRPLLTFGAPWAQYVYYRTHLNAAHEILDRTVARVGAGHVAIHDADRGEDWTYGRLQGAVNRLGNVLLGCGLRPGERVLLRVPDSPEAAVAQLATWKVGAIAVPTSVLDRAREVQFTLNDTEAAVAIVHAHHLSELEKARGACPHLRVVIAVGDDAADCVPYRESVAAAAESLTPYPSRPLDAASIFYTGGTTGYPKGCLHTHAAEVVLADLNVLARGTTERDVYLSHAPIGHAAGNGEKINFPFRAGAAAVYAFRPSPRRVWELAEQYGATAFLGAATMYRMMLRDAIASGAPPRRSTLRSALSSAEVLDERTLESWKSLTGLEIENVVGMVPLRHIVLHPGWQGRKLAPGLSVGRPLPAYEARLVDTQTGEPCGAGEVGRLALRGPTGITYWVNLHPDVRERAGQDVVGGWSLADDAYRRDEDGWLWFHSRLDDMIVTGGFKIAAPEVELVLKQHEAVADAAVVAAPDEVRGQVVKAYVVLQPGHTGSPDLVRALQDHAKATMAPYKYPRLIEFLAELPRDEYGKVQRKRLREGVPAVSQPPA
jgi:2-aminobenzoate-CoA ligase